MPLSTQSSGWKRQCQSVRKWGAECTFLELAGDRRPKALSRTPHPSRTHWAFGVTWQVEFRGKVTGKDLPLLNLYKTVQPETIVQGLGNLAAKLSSQEPASIHASPPIIRLPKIPVYGKIP